MSCKFLKTLGRGKMKNIRINENTQAIQTSKNEFAAFASLLMVASIALTAIWLLFMQSPANAQNASSNWVAIANNYKTLVIDTNDQQRHLFNVELAVTPQEQQRGLMGRMSLGQDNGMVFLYPQDRVVKMWMANTFIPLDMLFVDQQGKVIHIEHNTVPMSRVPIGPDAPVRAVLEISGGVSKELGIKVGDRVYLSDTQIR